MYIRLKTIIAVVLFGMLLMGYNLNPPNGKTGAPFDGSCKDCHQQTNKNYMGSLFLTGLPDIVENGETYPLELKMLVTKGTPKRTGFQIVSVSSDSYENAGTFEVGEEKMATFSKKGRDYLEHHGAKNFNGENEITWKFNWTVVDSLASDTIEFFVASVLANGSENSGDRVVKSSFKVQLDRSTDTKDVLVSNWDIFPNPALSYIFIKNGELSGEILDLFGHSIQKFEGSRINISNLSSGVYFLRIGDEVKRFVKK